MGIDVPGQHDDAIRRLEAVQAIVDVAIEPLGLQELLDRLLERLKAFLNADTVTILLLEGDSLVVRASIGLQSELVAKHRVPMGRGIAGRVAAAATAMVIDELGDEPEVWSPLLRERVHSMAAVPIVHGEAVIGVLHAGTEVRRDFQDDLLLLELVAERAAGAIVRTRLEEERAARAARAQLLADLSYRLSLNVEGPEEALQLAAEQIAVLLGDGCVLYLLSPDRRRLEPFAFHHRDPAGLELIRRALNTPLAVDGFIGRTADTGKTVFHPDISPEVLRAMAAPSHRAALDRQSIYGIINAPLRAHAEVLGIVSIIRTNAENPPYSEADRVFLEEFAARAAVAIDNARLYRRAHESEQRFRALLNSSRIGFVARDEEGRIVEANHAYAQMMGYQTPGELIGTDAEAVVAPEEVDAARQEFRQTFGGEVDSLESERSYVLRDSSVVHARRTTSLVRDADGTPLYALSLLEDVSERHRLEEQLRESQKMEALGRFAGAIAHDFNNVLTAITGFSALIAGELAGDDPLQSELDEIRAAAERAAGLTRQLLTFSRRRVVRGEAVSVNELIKRISPMLGQLLGDDVRLALNLSSTEGAVMADESQLEQVIVNLAVNARDAMPGGGRLSIEVQVADIGQEFARARLSLEPGRYVVIAVSDTGLGMDAETARKIFEPFFTTKPLGRGTGLGLSTVFGIVSQSDGKISVYSERGYGTTFRIYLPSTEPASARAEPQPADRADVEHRGGGTVLVVDDEEALRRVVQRLLERAGYTVLTAGAGDETLALLDSHQGPIDLLITDIVLPGMQGPEIAREARRLREDIKVLYSSGYPGDDIVRRGLDPDAAFLEKPFAPDQLVRIVSELINTER